MINDTFGCFIFFVQGGAPSIVYGTLFPPQRFELSLPHPKMNLSRIPSLLFISPQPL